MLCCLKVGKVDRKRLLLPGGCVLVVVTFMLSHIFGCQTRRFSDDPTHRRLKIVATTGMVADLVENIGGDKVQVIGLLGPGVDPHLYKASEGDVLLMAEADLIFYNGLHLEGRMSSVFERMTGRAKTVAVSNCIAPGELLTLPGSGGMHDPHIWFDVKLWSQAAQCVLMALVAADSANADYYSRRTAAYVDSLAALDSYIRQRVAEVAPSQRVLVTAHDAFNYFARAYGFEVRGLQGTNTSAEAGTADIRRLADFIAQRRIKAIFIESSIPLRSIESVQAAVRARGSDISIGGQLYSDAMGDRGTPQGTYLGMIKHNVDTIVGALR